MERIAEPWGGNDARGPRDRIDWGSVPFLGPPHPGACGNAPILREYAGRRQIIRR
jgi:hypothetical protein